MNLYLIKRDDPRDEIDWDEFRGHVIAAPDEETARQFASNRDCCRCDPLVECGHAYGEKFRTWLTSEQEGLAYPFFSTVTLLASDVDLQRGIVLSNFNAG
tara:strand:+ start:213 stop:512 length:300 start_codon:yes stop_codon:yes gene_type:complete